MILTLARLPTLKNHMKIRNHAFTLVELVVIILLISVVITVSFKSISSFHRVKQKMALESAAHWWQYLVQVSKFTCKFDIQGKNEKWILKLGDTCLEKNLKSIKEPLEYRLDYPISIVPSLPLQFKEQKIYTEEGVPLEIVWFTLDNLTLGLDVVTGQILESENVKE